MNTLFRGFALALLLLSLAFAAPAAERGALNNVPEAAKYALVYSLDIPNTPNYSNAVNYDIDLRANISGFSRVAYYLELQQGANPLKYVWVSMDAFTTNIDKVGVPTVASGAFFQQPVANMNVRSSVSGIVAGTNLSGGNIEFWPQNYALKNSANVPNAVDNIYDWGDSPYPGNYGSMQVHNHDARQVLFAFNRWGGWGGVADLGIGNNPLGQTDWTFMTNASNYSIKTLQVYVLANHEPFKILAQGFESPGNFKVLCEAQPGFTYSLWRKLEISTGTWTKVAEATAASSTMLLVDTTATNTTSLYQIRTP